jgi:CDP-glucose 4,6-dehydratase
MFDNAYKNKTVLVTGDSGFKGSWLAIWLRELGANVIGYSLAPRTSNDNYVVCGLKDKINHIEADLCDYKYLQSIFDKYKPDYVFHLAAQALVLESFNDPLETYKTNIMGTANVLESVRHTESVKSAVIITTDKCYENKEWVYGYRENDRLGGKDPYSSSKAACEIVIKSYMQSYFHGEGTASIASARAGNVIGGGDWADHRIVPDCIRSLEHGESISLRNPSAVRPWQHVLDPLSGYLKLGALLFKKGKEYSGSWNFGPSSLNMVTVKQLAEEIISHWGSGEINIEKTSHRYPESNILHLDISKAINKLKWQPKLSFKESIRYAIDEYQIDQYTKDQAYNQRVKHIINYSKK